MRKHRSIDDVKRDKDWKDDIRAAKELGYNLNVVERLKSTSDAHARQRILKDARLGVI